MHTVAAPAAHDLTRVNPSAAARWTGRVLTGVSAAALFLDSGLKLFELDEAVRGTTELGYPASAVFVIGVLEVISVLLYVIPRSELFGALLITGYLGGAVATHIRMQHPLFSHTLSPIYVAMFVWGGLVLRNPRVRAAFFAEGRGPGTAPIL